MLRKRTRSHQKHQILMESDFPRHSSHGNGSVFSIPGLFIGLSNKGLSDYDSAWSPTSPLDFRVFSSFSNPFARSPRSTTQNGHQKGWEQPQPGKVGLSIVDSLDDNTKLFEKVMRSSDSKNILFGPGMRIRNPECQNNKERVQEPKHVPKECPVFAQLFAKSLIQKGDKPASVVFEIGEGVIEKVESEDSDKIRSHYHSLDSYAKFPTCLGNSDRGTSLSLRDICVSNDNAPSVTSPRAHVVACPPPLKQSSGSFGSSNDGAFVESLSASEIELSEDYTCVISHGSNPKMTHFYGNLVLESLDNNNGFCNKEGKENPVIPSAVAESANAYPSDNFLSFCCTCHKKLEEGKDIYMYRGEKGFCSNECRTLEILLEEEMEKEEEEEEEEGESESKNSREAYEDSGGVMFTAV